MQMYKELLLRTALLNNVWSSKAQWSLICTASLTFTNSTFCPHSVFVCFVWIWEQTAIISLYSINWLVCITETVSVYCAVRTGYLCVLCESQNKQWLFPYTALTDWFYNRDGECLLCGTDWIFMCFVWIWEQTVIISLYSINWLVL